MKNKNTNKLLNSKKTNKIQTKNKNKKKQKKKGKEKEQYQRQNSLCKNLGQSIQLLFPYIHPNRR